MVTGGDKAVDKILRPIKYIESILSSQQILANSKHDKNNNLLLPFKYFSGIYISKKLRTA